MIKRQLAAKVAKFEGKKHQASMGDIMEILTILEKIEMDTGDYSAMPSNVHFGAVTDIILVGATKQYKASLKKKRSAKKR